MPLEIIATRESIDRAAGDVLLVAAFAGATGGVELSAAAEEAARVLDWSLAEYLSDSGFKGKPGELASVPALGKLPVKSVAVVGLGPRDETGPGTFRRAAAAAARHLAEQSVIVSVLHQAGDGDDITGAAAEGFLLGSYRFLEHKSDPHPARLREIRFLGAGEDAIERGLAYASAANCARDLTNETPAFLTPTILARRAQEIAAENGLTCTVLKAGDLKDKGFGGILGVSAGSPEEPRLIELRYSPEGATRSVALVGKGITFDSGGLSLKPAKGMETMKTDMGGAAAVLGAMSSLSRLSPKVEVRAYIASSENLPGPGAIKPGDVITHYSGTTSEVLNTDAEGRLVLADVLALASERSPDAIVDVATLTGAIVVALGEGATGLFCNEDDLADEIGEAGERAGERVWRMPLFDDYRKDLDSEIADIKNVSDRPGKSIHAALFLRDFVGEGIPWAHLDIAGTARAESSHDEVCRGGTGTAARTLLAFVEGRSS